LINTETEVRLISYIAINIVSADGKWARWLLSWT